MDTEARKLQHIETVLASDVAAKGVTPGFERFFFEHSAVPECNLSEIDISTSLFGKSLDAPLLISSMTGGTDKAEEINRNLAIAAQRCRIAMGLGSQRAALEDPGLAQTFKVRSVAPDILLFANFGAVQLNYGYGVDEARRAVDMIEADALFLHLNPLQEAVQPEGDNNWKGLYNRIEDLASNMSTPIIVKEVGNGISVDVARRLSFCGISGIDVAGAGGTSWSEVEAYRQPNVIRKRIAHTFSGWGIPTALSLIQVRSALPDLKIFASGGLRSGLDMAKAVAMGADLCGIAAPTLSKATHSSERIEEELRAFIEELRISAFCTGSNDLNDLKAAKLRKCSDWSEV